MTFQLLEAAYYPGSHAKDFRLNDHASHELSLSEAVIYSCPMHDDVQQTLSGPCSICGMGLESPMSIMTANTRRYEDETLMSVVVGSTVAGYVCVSAPVMETTPAALNALHELDFRIIMATGEYRPTERAGGERRASTKSALTCSPKTRHRFNAHCRMGVTRWRLLATA